MKRLLAMLIVLAVTGLVGLGVTWAEEGKKPEKPKPTPEQIFKRLDKDGDGKLTLEEFLANKKPEAKEKAEKFFKAKDTNGDGVLSLEEFVAKPPRHEKKKGQ